MNPIPETIASKLFVCPRCGKTAYRSRTDKVFCTRRCKENAHKERRDA
jgi:endogenous inhibitor of DNA gyrase (YacG/DUF329 family)